MSQGKTWPADADQCSEPITASARPQGFPRRLRLLSREDFQRVFDDTRCKSVDENLLVLATPNGRDYPRLGLAISKRNVKTAVGRNRVKRLVRESFRRHRQQLAGLDIVVLSRHATHDSSNPGLLHSLNRHWRRLVKRCANSSSS
ncbi:MAG TPA: ribonuclease P protein component [Gammaproteobacteria bacterium]|nr:ribonuclease P protein component [Gammaproteobacteria bacterium]